MTGHIYCRDLSNGRQGWYAVIDVAAPGEPRKQVTKAFVTRRAARAWAAEQDSRRTATGGGTTIGQFLTVWWLDGRRFDRPPSPRTAPPTSSWVGFREWLGRSRSTPQARGPGTAGSPGSAGAPGWPHVAGRGVRAGFERTATARWTRSSRTGWLPTRMQAGPKRSGHHGWIGNQARRPRERIRKRQRRDHRRRTRHRSTPSRTRQGPPRNATGQTGRRGRHRR